MLSWQGKSFVRLSCRVCKISDFRPWIWSLSEINIPEFLALLINVWHLPLRQSLPCCLGWATQFILPAKSLNHTIPSPTFLLQSILFKIDFLCFVTKIKLVFTEIPSDYFQTFFLTNKKPSSRWNISQQIFTDLNEEEKFGKVFGTLLGFFDVSKRGTGNDLSVTM